MADCFRPAYAQAAAAGLLLCATLARAQGNYEVQVYGSETVPAGNTMVEFHTNYTLQGSKDRTGTILPTNHQFHETLEITHGFTGWFELGYYNFTSAQAGYGWNWVGTHLRPRVAAPKSWGLPVGLSLSTEVGYQRPLYSADTWTWELRPIVDKELGRWYVAFNPALEGSLHGESSGRGFEFSPNVKGSYRFTHRVTAGIEYYGALGPLSGFNSWRDQQQQILPAIDLDLGERWEFNAGVGVGVTRSTDHLLIKWILGYRLNR